MSKTKAEREAEQAAAEQSAQEAEEAQRQAAAEEQRKADEEAQRKAAQEAQQKAVEGAATTKPYGTENPAPGAAGYDAPELNPKPGTPEWHALHPADITSGAYDPKAARDEQAAQNDADKPNKSKA